MGLFRRRKPKVEELIGASAKLAAAERMKNSSRMDAHEDSSKGQAYSQTIPATIVFVLCAGLVAVSMEGSFINVSGWSPTGINNLDNLLVGKNPHKFMGDEDLNRVIIILIRSFALFIASGAVPFLGLLATRMVAKGKVNPFIACWGAIVAIPLMAYAVLELILPLVEDLL